MRWLWLGRWSWEWLGGCTPSLPSHYTICGLMATVRLPLMPSCHWQTQPELRMFEHLFNLKRGFQDGPLFLGEIAWHLQLATGLLARRIVEERRSSKLCYYILLWLQVNLGHVRLLEKASSLTCNQCSAVIVFSIFVPSKPPTPPSMPLVEEKNHPKLHLVIVKESRFLVVFHSGMSHPDVRLEINSS